MVKIFKTFTRVIGVVAGAAFQIAGLIAEGVAKLIGAIGHMCIRISDKLDPRPEEPKKAEEKPAEETQPEG